MATTAECKAWLKQHGYKFRTITAGCARLGTSTYCVLYPRIEVERDAGPVLTSEFWPEGRRLDHYCWESVIRGLREREAG